MRTSPDLEFMQINRISGYIPNELNHLTSLEQLSVRECSLSGTLPEVVGLDLLYFLAFDKNKISGTLNFAVSQLGFLKATANKLSGTVAPVTNILFRECHYLRLHLIRAVQFQATDYQELCQFTVNGLAMCLWPQMHFQERFQQVLLSVVRTSQYLLSICPHCRYGVPTARESESRIEQVEVHQQITLCPHSTVYVDYQHFALCRMLSLCTVLLSLDTHIDVVQ